MSCCCFKITFAKPISSYFFYLLTVDELDSVIASPVSEMLPLPEITLAVAEAYPFRTSRQYLELWRINMIRNDEDHTLRFDERRSIAWVKNVHTEERVLVFSTSDVRVVKAYYLIFRLLNSNIHATRDYILQNSPDAINEFVMQTTPDAAVEGCRCQCNLM